MIERKQYELEENIDIEKLIEAGFNEVESGNKTFLVYYKELITDIDLFVEFDITNSCITGFDENRNITVIDDEIGQYYGAFYRNEKNSYVNKAIKRYNEVMDELVSKKIFKVKEIEKVKQLKKVNNV